MGQSAMKHAGCRVGVMAMALLVWSCGEDAVVKSSAATASTAPGRIAPPAASAGATAATTTVEAPMPPVAFQEEDFSENDKSRDPFRSFQDMFLEKSDRRIWQRAKVLLETYSLDDLRLIGLVTGIVPAKAMVVDPTGKGHVIQRNDLIGKAERVQAGAGGDEFEINWRVERIRESDVVFVREDPANPDVPSATRVLSLRTEADDARP